MSAANPDTPPRLTMAAAVEWSGVSAVTLRKQLAAGRIEAERVRGAHGDEWAIDAASLATLVRLRYGRELPPVVVAPQPPQPIAVTDAVEAETLRARVDELLEELGRYKGLVAAADTANERVEAELRNRIAELTTELQAERARTWWSRLWGKTT